MNKLTIMSRFVLYTLNRNLARLAIITRKRKMKNLKGGGSEKGQKSDLVIETYQNVLFSTAFQFRFLFFFVVIKR